MTPPQTPTTRWTQDPGGAAAAGGGAGRTKPIIPTFAGEGNNIFEISSLTQEIIDSFLGYCLHARIARDKRLKNLTQCLTGVAKKWFRTETKFVGDFTNWDAFETKFRLPLRHRAHTRRQGHAGQNPVHQGRRGLPQFHRLLSSLPVRGHGQPADKADHLPSAARLQQMRHLKRLPDP